MTDFIKNKLSFLDTHTLEVLKNSSSSTLVRAAGMASGLFVSIFLGQTIGVDGLGIITLATKVSGVVLIICLLGIRQIIVKEVAIGFEHKRWQHIRDVLFSSYLISGGVTFVVAVSLVLLAPYLADHVFDEPRIELPLIIIVISLIPHIISRIFSSGLIGLSKIWQGNFVDKTLGYLLIGIILFILWLFFDTITLLQVAIAFAVGRLLVTVGTSIYYRKILSPSFGNRPAKFIGGRLLKTSLPLLLVGASSIIASNADSIILGWLNNSHQVGLYVVAARVALLTSFFLHVTNSAISPKIAALYSKGRIKKMEEMVQKITSILLIVAVLSISIFLLFGETILSIWGGEFSEAYWILIILSVGQFFDISTGAAGLTLMLCGHERTQGVISVSFVLLNLLLNYIFILNYGALGAASATAITVAGENITKVILVKKKIGILTIPSNLSFKEVS